MPEALIVIPCFNEARRLSPPAFSELARTDRLGLLFVDDGSQDATAEVLAEICERSGPTTDFIRLDRNQGKAEATRRGMLAGIEQGAQIVGYADADLSTPVAEIVRVLQTLKADSRAGVSMGARVLLSGRHIRRRAERHYLGRIFSTVASLILRAPIYDTQCGAKFFRVTPVLRHALATRFHSRWAFDVELLGRLLVGDRDCPPLQADQIVEVPLMIWEDVAGSKLRTRDMVKAAADLAVIARQLNRRRRRASGPTTGRR